VFNKKGNREKIKMEKILVKLTS